MSNLIKCPKCGEEIEINKALSEQVRGEVKDELAKSLEIDLRRQFEEKTKLELMDLKQALEEKEKKVTEFRDQELKLRQEKRALEEKGKEVELEMTKRLDEERKIILEEASIKALEEFRLKEKEKDKVISDLKTALENAQRKAQQSSQQLQGEILELDLEETLRNTFRYDSIEPVGKGIHGADIKQVVKTPKGTVCGTILWESKRTKAWANEWLGKIKADLRSAQADIPVIVSMILPKEIKCNLGLLENVWVSDLPNALMLAELLRQRLIDVARERFVAQNKQSKSESIYEYVTSNSFKQQVEALAEVFYDMQNQVVRERAAFEKIWKTREAQAQRLFKSTAGIVGEIQGKVGAHSMPQIKGLEILELEDGNNRIK